ncbi:DUF3592 domain-containing protein [Haloferula chungangensis]|uniref:DUF3592 domain-containing protein n=1 Tax=Haloferula chungangensis TaxID=1048331 RepID=A0ABW2L758_9BACT
MEWLANTIALLVGISCFALAGWHERTWWVRAKWIRTTGEVVGITRQGSEDTEYPKISFVHDGRVHEFTSGYGGTGCSRIGDSVVVVVDPVTLKAEQVTTGNRVLFTIAPIAFGLLFSAIGLHGVEVEDHDAGQGATSSQLESGIEPMSPSESEERSR